MRLTFVRTLTSSLSTPMLSHVAGPASGRSRLVELATRDDIPRITEIYNHAVLHSTVTAEWEPNTADQRLEWFEKRERAGYPTLVTRDNGVVSGWASLSPYNPRRGYQYTAEDSVYIAPEAQGQGLGTLLLNEIIAIAREKQFHLLFAGMDSENIGSIKLHEKFGFVKAGHYHEMVFKFGRWLDVVHYELRL